MESLTKKKYDFLLYILEEGDAMVCVDARNIGVDVPLDRKNNSSLNLIFNLNFKRPIEIDDQGIFAALAFNGKPYQCTIPYEAIWAIYDPKMKNGQVWEESIPKDINFGENSIETISPSPPEKLKTVKSGNKLPKPVPAIIKRNRSHLRVIK